VLTVSLENLSGQAIAKIPASPQDLLSQEGEESFVIVQPVAFEGQSFGTLQVRVSLAPVSARARTFQLGVVAVIVGLGALSFWYALFLQRLITRPILHLAGVARRVTERHDYSLRAIKTSEDEVGLLAGTFNTMLDEIQRRQREIQEANVRSDFLSRATAVLVESLELDTTVSRLAQFVVPFLGEWCEIDLLDADGALRRVATAHWNPTKQTVEEKLPQSAAVENTPLKITARAVESATATLVPEVSKEAFAAQGLEERDLQQLQATGTRSLVVVPLAVGGRVLGAFTIGSGSRRHTRADLEFSAEFARRAALAVDNARHYQEAQEAILVRERFLSVAAHELKTPLTPLKLQVQAMESILKRDESTFPILRSSAIMNRQLRRLERLVNQLLEVSRLTRGVMVLERETFDLRDILTQVIEQVGYELETSGSSLTVYADQEAIGHWDSLRLEQVLINLLTNSIKFGLGRPIVVRIEPSPDRVRLAVTDHGIGISSESKSRIFKPFERGVSDRRYGGLGLGLYIASEIVNAHHGSLRVERAPDGGTTFVLELPRS
jgi:signal transduction histidine kinase